MQTRTNRRGNDEHYVSGHLKLNALKKKAKAFGLENQYLWKGNIPEYPKPEFQVSHLKHDTTGSGLEGIRKDGGFKAPSKDSKDSKDSKESKNEESFIWWSLVVGPEEMKDAELRLLEKTFPGMEEEAAEQQSFLQKFATSPAFQETSWFGSYRFTFPLEEVLTAYRDQFCSGAEPVMRAYETVLYKQEVMYVVLVHSPEFNGKFSKIPLLKDNPEVCVYRDGRFIWRAEAMCETHWYELVKKNANQMEAKPVVGKPQFYVWDHVAVALHVEDEQQVLKFDVEKLRQNLKYCKKGNVTTCGSFTDFDEAKVKVQTLWPKCPGPLEVERSLQLSYQDILFESVFDKDAWRRTMILLTHQNQTEPDIQNLLLEVQEILGWKVGYRYRVFNSSLDHRDPRLVSDLLNEVKEMIVQL